MNKFAISFLLIIPFFIISCKNNNKLKTDRADDSMTSQLNSDRKDTTTLISIVSKFDSLVPNRDDQTLPDRSDLKTDDYINQYPPDQKAELRRHIEQLIKEWQDVPNPMTATYEGNDFGDYHHILFKDAKGVVYDFGQANNNLGQYKLHELSGQYEDNPKFLGKKFKVYWNWKLADFVCCEGEYNKVKAYLPAITKLELIK